MRSASSDLAVTIIAISSAAAFAAEPVSQWTIHESSLQSARDYDDPLWDVHVWVDVAGPGGNSQEIEAFWDGGRTWRFRFSPHIVGAWHWRSRCSDPTNNLLHNQSGQFECAPYRGDNPLYRHGPVRLSDDRRHFVYADGTPFFWLADTAWNGVLKSSRADWDRYLDARRDQRFTAIQFVSTQWRGGRDTLAEPIYFGEQRIAINPLPMQRMDQRIDAINQRGMIASPVILWALNEGDPGVSLPEPDATRLAEYIVARWGAHQVIWMLSGDCRFAEGTIDRWKRIGREVFKHRRDRLVTLHASGRNWIADQFAGESWFDFIGYQSGHGDGERDLNWLTSGPPTTYWNKLPRRPIINLEPNYEAHPAYQSKKPHDDHHVRRAAYWSLMIAPPAGLTYGHNAIWVWNETASPAENHRNVGTVQPWYTGLDTPGIRSMTIMRDFFESGPWSDLRPAQALLAEQLGETPEKTPDKFVTAATSTDRRWTIAYLPEGGRITLRTDLLELPAKARWFDPRSGQYREIGTVPENRATFTAPDDNDWLLDIRAGR